MSRIRVLVVDDSRLTRDVIRSILTYDSEIEVIGEAGNGRDAVRKVLELGPDVVTMDVEMPVMNGLEAIKEIMAARAVPILVISSLGDARTAYNAISNGALEVLPKTDVDLENPHELISKIKLLSRVKVISHIKRMSVASDKDVAKPSESRPAQAAAFVPQGTGSRRFRIVAIASSTGGPKALAVLLADLPAGFPVPMVVAQHISDGFVAGMVDWLSTLCKLKIKVAEDGDPVLPGTVYVSPSSRHMKIMKGERVKLVDRKPEDIYRPSCDMLLSSVADAYGARSIGVILTGMGDDGVEGMGRIKQAGGLTIAQDEKSSAIFGMPRVAIEKGYADKVLPLERICSTIMNHVK